MPKSTTYSSHIRPFVFHGLTINQGGEEGNNEQVSADCPFCSRSNKFYIEPATGQWSCMVCRTGTDKGGGNIYTFLRLLWDESDKATNDYKELALDRGLMEPETLIGQVAKSIITGDWIVPGYNPDKKINQLYRYVYSPEKKKKVLYATPELGHQLFGVHLYDPNKPDVFLCEGPWDMLAMVEILGKVKTLDKQLQATANPNGSLLSEINVLATPGCNVFNSNWLPLFAGKKVVMLFDNDYPKKHPKTGKTIEPAGYSGMKKIVNQMALAEESPEAVGYHAWSKTDMHNPDFADGADLRDLLKFKAFSDRVIALSSIFSRIAPIPSEWISGRKKSSAKGKAEIECLPCTKWKELINQWRKALKWTDGLDKALSVMLASVISTKAIGDQLWIKVIGPAACGKSTLCEALSIAKKYVKATSTMRGFHSGFKTDRGGNEDNSLVAQLYDKTLVTKDGDTLLQSPNLGQILSEARDIYDRTSRTHYRNKMGKDYEGLSMTWILAGTSSLRCLDSSELGERFLDCVIMEGIDEDLEDEILIRVANRTKQGMALEANSEQTTHQTDPELTKAMQLTGGYVNHLRENANELLARIGDTPEAMKAFTRLGKFVAFMRARPSSRQKETAEREFAPRLVSQLTRLGVCLAAVMNRTTLDEEVVRRVRLIALDTARGISLELMKLLNESENGYDSASIPIVLQHKREDVYTLLRFLKRIGVIHTVSIERAGVKGKPRWVMTDRFKKLYDEVMEMR